MAMCRKWIALVLALCVIAGLYACGKKQADGLRPRFSTLYSADFPQEFLDDPQKYQKEIDGFGVEDFAATFADPSAFRCFNAEILLSNDNDFAVNILTLKVNAKNVGKNGVYIGTFGDGTTVGLPAHYDRDNAVYYKVIADASLTDEQVLQALEDMHVKVVYVDAATGAESMEEANEADLMESVIQRAA